MLASPTRHHCSDTSCVQSHWKAATAAKRYANAVKHVGTHMARRIGRAAIRRNQVIPCLAAYNIRLPAGTPCRSGAFLTPTVATHWFLATWCRVLRVLLLMHKPRVCCTWEATMSTQPVAQPHLVSAYMQMTCTQTAAAARTAAAVIIWASSCNHSSSAAAMVAAAMGTMCQEPTVLHHGRSTWHRGCTT